MDKTIAFILGAAAGSLLTWKLIEKKYKQIADEEIESVIEHYKTRDREFSKLASSDEVKTSEIKVEDYSSEKRDYSKKVQDLGYTNEDENKTTDIHEVFIEPGVDHIEPFVIAPEEFGESGYDTKSWTYYADFVLTDEVGEIVVDAENIIGDGLTHFGEYEDDSVYVRNENIECDYEILKHEKTFSEINEVDI